MSLTVDDTDGLIAYHIFNCHIKRGLNELKRIMIAFGKSNHDTFIKTCIRVYYNKIFNELNVTSIEELIKKVIHKQSIKNYQHPKKFIDNPNEVFFSQLNAQNRLFIYHYSLYHGYLPIKSNSINREYLSNKGYDMYCYYDFWDNRKNKPAPYYVLRQKHIHDLKYYDCVKKLSTLDLSLFIPRPDVNIYKVLPTKTTNDITCIKII